MSLGAGPGAVQGQEAGQDFFVRQVGRPAVGGGDRLVQGPVQVGEPLRALVVEVRERAPFQVRRGLLVDR